MSNEVAKNDPKVWDLLQSGVTKGIFQLETRLAQHWIKKAKPTNLWELSILLALLRPGALMSGAADEYVAYRNNEKEFEGVGHPVVDEILSVTGNVLTYQEQLMLLGAKLAWPDFPEKERGLKVDELRKAVGKKNQEKILKIGKEFVEGCVRNKVDKELANRLFEVIRNCGRYLFNLSHSFSYAEMAYETAHCKVYHPLQFFATYLSYAKFKQAHKKRGKEIGGKWNEIKELSYEASKYFDIKLLPPNINCKNEHFAVEDGAIRYGLSHMKYFGANTITKIKTLPKIDKWQQFILLTCTDRFGIKLGKNSVEALICTGSFGDIKLSRQTLLAVYNFLSSLTEREMSALANLIENNIDAPITVLPELIEKMANTTCNKKRLVTVESEIKLLKLDLFDVPDWIEKQEIYYLGLPITASGVDLATNIASHKCSDVYDNLPDYTKLTINIVIDEVRETVTRKGKKPGQKMCFVTGHDQSGQIEKIPVFPDNFAVLSDILAVNHKVSLTLCKGKGGWFVESGEKLQ